MQDFGCQLKNVLKIVGAPGAVIATFVFGFASITEPLKTILFYISTGISLIILGYCYGNTIAVGLKIKAIYSKRTPDRTKIFIEKELKKAMNSGKKIQIDCLGAKHENIIEILEEQKENMDKVTIRLLLLNSHSSGADDRAIIEGTLGELPKSINYAMSKTLRVKGIIESRGSKVFIKTYNFLPSFYILRINDSMIVGFYLKVKGKDGPYMKLTCGRKSLFSFFDDYFEQLFCSSLAREPDSNLADSI